MKNPSRKLKHRVTDMARYFGPGQRAYVAAQAAAFLAAVVIFLAANVFGWVLYSGAAAVIAAFVAAIMSLHPKMTSAHKAVWILLIGAFVAIELVDISLERREAARQQRRALADEREHFAQIGRDIEAAISNGERQFRATLAKEEAVLEETRSAAELSRLNLQTMTGEGSHPCVVPQSHGVVNGSVPLVIWNRGAAPLTGVETRVLSDPEFMDGTSIFHKPSAKIDTLRREWPKPLPDLVRPAPGADGVASYQIEIWTQNGFYVEVLNFRPGKYQLPWAYQYWLTRLTPLRPKHSHSSQVVKDCLQDKWSDDLGDGKPLLAKP